MSAIEVQLYNEAKLLREDMVFLRRDLHMHPELGTKEVRTSGVVQNFLTEIGVEHTQMCGTAVVGLIHGKKPGGVVALRADMDALPMQDMKVNCPYRSQNDGVMHACGHDVHTTALLYAAKLLMAHREEICGTVKLFFEPNEETGGYARKMIENGVMEDPKVDAVFAIHQSPFCQVGKVCAKAGRISSASGKFKIRVYGKAAHGAEPQNGVDAVLIACQIALALQQCVSRSSNPEDAVALTIGTIRGGEVKNVVARECEMTGIHRTPTLEIREEMNRRIERIAAGIAAAMGGSAECEFDNGAAPVINDDAMTALVQQTAANMLGKDKVLHEGSGALPITSAEDCGEFISAAKGCYYNVGSRNEEKGITAAAHTNCFDVDEDCLPLAAAMHAAVAINYLRSIR